MERLGTVAIVGVGLIGGSIGMALRARGLCARVVGIGRDEAKLSEAIRLGAIDVGTTEPGPGVSEARVVVVCTPVTRIAADVRGAAHYAPEDVLIMDAGSTKRRIVEAVERDERARAVFVGAHPIAGSERQGVAHADARLFEGRACALTPTARTPADRLDRARAFWSSLGCQLHELGPARHDDTLARTSHLPHVVASALAAVIPPDDLPLAAGAYRDGTRVAEADGPLWVGIFRENREPLLKALGEFQNEVVTLKRALLDDDEAALLACWQAARARRARFTGPARPEPPAGD